ncbi:MAG: helix-turn-helix transcriptional regulator [Eubacterium sp.]|nr:helix-turn-helix transcriptional regulator [Eubacterium sp.]
MDVYEKLDELKKSKDWTNYRIAKESNLPVATVDNIYKQKSMPQIDTLGLLCKGFGITLSQFFLDVKIDPLDDTQVELLELWEHLSDEKKDALKTIMTLIV